MMTPDANTIELLLSPTDQDGTVFQEYVEDVANQGLQQFQTIFQWGNKRGESLYTHVMNGVCILESLQPIIKLAENEQRLMFTAYTLHDINKFIRDERLKNRSFNDIATTETLADVIKTYELGLLDFFPDWEDYLHDITYLVRSHSGHYEVAGEGMIPKLHNRYALDFDRLQALGQLMTAVDVLDLSHTVDERKHKDDFLSGLNAYLADTNSTSPQYTIHTHQLVEQRGLLTSVIHNAVMDVFTGDEHVIVLALYPDGVAYLAPKDYDLPSHDTLLDWLANATRHRVDSLLAGDADKLINQTNQGIKIKPDALALGAPFRKVWEAVGRLVVRRKFKTDEFNQKARTRILKDAEAVAAEKRTDTLLALIEQAQAGDDFIAASQDQLVSAEYARTFYLMLRGHLDFDSEEAWSYIYDLLELPDDERERYSYFDPQYIRPYVLAGHITLSQEEVFNRLEAEGERLWQDFSPEQSDESPLWADYLSLYLLIDGQPLTIAAWQDHLSNYIHNEHRQCAHCSSPFPTQPWMAADVRDGITVQVFSNRLEGGSKKEPKKYICEVCRIQFLLETLNFAQVRGEDLFYLHLFPYSFLTAPYLRGFFTAFNQLRGTDFALQALNMNEAGAINRKTEGQLPRPTFSFQTKKGKPQPYGVYVPQYAETLSGIIILPLNAPGDNDTEKYLFALWNAMILQEHFGMRVLLSKSPVPPLPDEAMPDLFLDSVPLRCAGLVPESAYFRWENGTQQTDGNLVALWERVEALFALGRIVFTKSDEKPNLAGTMTQGPLNLYFEVDRLLEKAGKDKQAHWKYRHALPHIETIAINLGGKFMQELSQALRILAADAWQNRLRGGSLKRSSLLHPYNEVIAKMQLLGSHADREAIIAATTEDIFDHLQRIADEQYKPGLNKLDAVANWVRQWYELVLDGVYNGNVQKLLADEKLLRSAYLFYIQQSIPRKTDNDQQNDLNEEE